MGASIMNFFIIPYQEKLGTAGSGQHHSQTNGGKGKKRQSDPVQFFVVRFSGCALLFLCQGSLFVHGTVPLSFGPPFTRLV